MNIVSSSYLRLLFLLIWILGGVKSGAQELVLVGESIDLSSGTVQYRRSPADVTYNSVDAQYLAVWYDNRNPTAGAIFGQIVSDQGELIGSNFTVTVGPSVDPAIVYNLTQNEYFVVWRNHSSQTARGLVLSASGIPVGAEIPVSGGGFEADVAYNSNRNEYYVTSRNPNQIIARRLSSDGSPIGGEIFVTDEAAPNGGLDYDFFHDQYLAVWRGQFDLPRDQLDVRGRLLSGEGIPLGNELVLSSREPRNVRVVFDSVRNRYFIVFSLFNEFGLYGLLLSASGELIGEDFKITDTTAFRSPHAVTLSKEVDGFVLVWQESGNLLGQFLSPDGQTVGLPLTIAERTASEFGEPSITGNPDLGELFVSWEDVRTGADIYGQRLRVSNLEREVSIDVLPFNPLNVIRPRPGFRGLSPFVIFSEPGFDAVAEVDKTSLTMGRTGDEVSVAGCLDVGFNINGRKDRLPDLVCYFHAGPADFYLGKQIVVLKGRTIRGGRLRGEDRVVVLRRARWRE